jgi:membrane protein
MNAKVLLIHLRQSFNDWNEDNAPRLGAALAFYTILSISPLVILAIAIVSLIFDRSRVQSHLLAEVQGMVGSAGRDAVQTMLQSGRKASSGTLSTAVGLITLAFGATGVFGELRSALNQIWDANPKNSSGLIGLVRERFFSLGMVFSVGFILLVSLVVSAVLAAVTKFFSGLLPIPGFVLTILSFVVSLGAISILFGLILKYVPETRVEWRDVRVGAIATAVMFTIGKTLLGLYLGKASPGSAYGAAGSLVAMVIWVYYSAQIFFFGAEFTHVVAQTRRGTLEPPRQAAPPEDTPDVPVSRTPVVRAGKPLR